MPPGALPWCVSLPPDPTPPPGPYSVCGSTTGHPGAVAEYPGNQARIGPLDSFFGGLHSARSHSEQDFDS
ncbi:Hypp1541 [Branchiostoma lanceolatum]|uniref:Hypp1541 protein n=1 Tax=Branchiostoma lanceolatum TaxID=7740 RepID=A0A8J9ZIR3_BRALA|nr:Hypp1541 [Branchiostoma lanceolatum]